MTFNPSTLLVVCEPPTVGGVFIIFITGTITNAAGTFSDTTNFKLTVSDCLSSTDEITISQSITTPVTMSLTNAYGDSYTVA
jgi:hypothetical protein